VFYTCGTFSTPAVDPKSDDAYQDLLGIYSCATAVIVHSMCRLVYGDIAEGKKLVDFKEIFCCLWRFLNCEVIAAKRKLRDLLVIFKPALY
jgi:hypothetical protein